MKKLELEESLNVRIRIRQLRGHLRLTSGIEKAIENHLKGIDIKQDDWILDFGCGEGVYTIPLAVLVGEKGRIIAIDEDQEKLDELINKATEDGIIDRIQPIKTDGELEIPIEDNVIDLTLLYNVACCILGKDNYSNLEKLLKDIYRVTKKKGKLIIGVGGTTMEKRMEIALPMIEKYFQLELKERRRYVRGKNQIYGMFYFLNKREGSVIE